MNAVERYIENIEQPALKNITIQLRQLIRTTLPQVEECLKWRIPYYMYCGHLCYINARPKLKRVELGFMKGSSLSNASGILTIRGKLVAHIIMPAGEEIPEAAVIETLLEAALINEMT